MKKKVALLSAVAVLTASVAGAAFSGHSVALRGQTARIAGNSWDAQVKPPVVHTDGNSWD